jgi:hypothetical protein
MSDSEFFYLILGLVAGAVAGYGLRAYRSYRRRQRYRTSSAYHIHGAQAAAPASKEAAKDANASS